MTFFSFQHRAKIELARSLYLDQKRREASITPEQRQALAEDPDHFYDKMREEWHLPPHIEVRKTGVSFGEMWDTLPEAGAEEEEE